MNAAAAIVRLEAGPVPMASEREDVLIARTKSGDVEAFSELIRRHEGVVYSLAYRFMRNASSAEDMAQEAFLKAFRLLRGFRGECSFATWLYRVTCSVCLSELSRRSRRAEVPLDTEHDEAISPAEAPSDLPEAIRQCVTRLPEHYATIITLYYLEGVSYEDIAHAMHIPMGTLKTWMHRARHDLRAIVEKELGAHAIESIA